MYPFGKGSIERKVGDIFSHNDQFILGTLFYPFSLRLGYVEENQEQFLSDLKRIRPMFDRLFDFETILMKKMQYDEAQFMMSGHYRYLRACLIDRWEILNQFQTYPNMPKLLPVKRH